MVLVVLVVLVRGTRATDDAAAGATRCAEWRVLETQVRVLCAQVRTLGQAQRSDDGLDGMCALSQEVVCRQLARACTEGTEADLGDLCTARSLVRTLDMALGQRWMMLSLGCATAAGPTQ